MQRFVHVLVHSTISGSVIVQPELRPTSMQTTVEFYACRPQLIGVYNCYCMYLIKEAGNKYNDFGFSNLCCLHDIEVAFRAWHPSMLLQISCSWSAGD